MTDTWDHFETWELVLPPSRPSVSHLAMVRSAISDQDRNSPVAVLGSTPEFRDLLHECGFERVHIFDRNPEFYMSMSRLRVFEGNETLVIGDWLKTLPQFAGEFSVFLSDLTMGNVPYDRRKEFYDVIARALRSSGVFWDKVLTHPGDHLQVEALLTKYSELPVNLLYTNHFSCEMLFCSELLDLEEMVNSTRFYDVLLGQDPNERIRKFVREAEKITPRGCHWYYGRRWRRLENDYCTSLKTISVRDDDESSPYFGRLKLFTHVKE